MYDRLIRLIGSDNVTKLGKLNILLVGIGGVGGTALEALVRSGIKNITIIDSDIFEESNLNRQIMATSKDIGKDKVSVALKRVKDINKDINIKALKLKIAEDNLNAIGKFDYIIDACDDLKAKVALIKYAKLNNIKIISALGTGKRLNPTLVEITSLKKTINDPLAKKLRYTLRGENLSLDIPVVYSKELPLNRDTTVASAIFVPSVAGLYLAYYVIYDYLS